MIISIVHIKKIFYKKHDFLLLKNISTSIRFQFNIYFCSLGLYAKLATRKIWSQI